MDDVILKLDGQVFGGWTTIGIDRALDNLSAQFSLGLTERWPGQPERRAIRKGCACQLFIGDDLVLTGWIDSVNRKRRPGDHSITASGRDRTCDLADCSAVDKPLSWHNATLDTIASDVIKPFGLKLKVLAPIGAPFAHFAVEHGESVFETLSRGARMRGLLLGSDTASTLLIYTPANTAIKTRLVLGENLLELDVTDDATDLFSRYIVKGQSQGEGVSAADAAGAKGEVLDKGVTRYRPLLLLSDDQATPKGLQDRAAWEATVRSAKSQSVSAPVKGWRENDGALWTPGGLVDVVAPQDDVQAQLRISGVSFSIDKDQGKVTNLTLVRPEAYTIEPLPEAKPKKNKRSQAMDGL